MLDPHLTVEIMTNVLPQMHDFSLLSKSVYLYFIILILKIIQIFYTQFSACLWIAVHLFFSSV